MTFNNEKAITIYTGPGPWEITTEVRSGFTIEGVIGGWLDEIFISGSQSQGTSKDYRAIILNFRAFLQESGRDLLYENIEFRSQIATAAQIFAGRRLASSNHKGPISAATIAHRYAVLSSFYEYAYRMNRTPYDNPIDKVKRPKVQPYQGARALEAPEIAAWLDDINASDPAGLRDLALLVLLFSTGRRASEIASLRRKNLELVGKQIKIRFDRLKGGKTGSNLLDQDASEHLRYWLHVHYRGLFWRKTTNPDAPIFPNLKHPESGRALGYQGIRDVIKFRSAGPLGERNEQSRVHVTRHSFAMLMIKANAKLTEIQAALGHSTIDTTAKYIELMKEPENQYSPEISAALNLKKLTAKRLQA